MLGSWSQQPSETAGQSCAGSERQLCPSTHTSTRLRVLTVTGWDTSCVHGERPPVSGGMGQANCCCASRTPEGAKRAQVTRLFSLTLLEKLSHRHAWRSLNTGNLEKLLEGQAKVGQPKGGCDLEEQGQALGSGRWTCFCGDTEPLLLPPAWRKAGRKQGQALPLACQRCWQASRVLFGQPLAALCGEDGMLPQPIQELLAVLQQEGPSTEGVFRRAASGTAHRELREALDHGADVNLQSQPALLLAVILKDFLRNIPGKLLVVDLYEDWMAAMQKSSREEKVQELKAVGKKLPAANVLLLERLLSLLQHIGHNAASSKMSCSNLAVCIGPNLLSPGNEDLLPLETLLQVTEK
ncbi:PREDICTED: T-cell activation Rho GTPase-activating protein-like, partial [Chlamydotis macqueenii]|uniref:T-cell activation Rho GTPase-activating protein-like n=1 Tax=Chlamydotis macqueenii TaxID=187382 RepID=UPI000529DECB